MILQDRELHEECGVFAVCGYENAAAMCYYGLHSLQHRGQEAAGIIAITKVAALAYLMFNLYTPPCFAAIGAMNAEMKSRKWVLAGIGLQLGTGYTLAYLVYTAGTLITAPETLNTAAALGGLAAVLVFAGILTYLTVNSKNKIRKEYASGR